MTQTFSLVTGRSRREGDSEQKVTTGAVFACGIIIGIVFGKVYYHVPKAEVEHAQLVTVEKKVIPTLKKEVATEKTVATVEHNKATRAVRELDAVEAQDPHQ